MPSIFIVRSILELGPRQLDPTPTAPATTISQTPPSSVSTLDVDPDPSHSGTIAGIPLPTLTVTSSDSVSSTSSTPSSTPHPTAVNAIGTPVIAGIAVGVFALLALSLVLTMVVRNRRRNVSRKTGSQQPRIDGQPTRQDQRRRESERGAHKSFLSLSSARGMVLQDAAPTLPQPDVGNGNLSIPSQFRYASPAPAHSHRPSTSSSGDHTQDTSGLLASQSSRYTHAHSSSIAASSLSDYPETLVRSGYPFAATDVREREMSSVTHVVTRASSVMVDYRGTSAINTPDASSTGSGAAPKSGRGQQARVETDSGRPGAALEADDHDVDRTRERELKAMHDLIAALDSPGLVAPSLSSSDLRVDTTAAVGMSRLSMGEGIVTPAGTGPSSTPGSDHTPLSDDFPLPPADVFRTALGFEGQRKG